MQTACDLSQQITHRIMDDASALCVRLLANICRCWPFYLSEVSLFVPPGNVPIQVLTTQPGVYDKFSKAFQVVYRSNQFWAGLSSDLVIDHILIRSLKSSGSLTHGSGMTEEMR